MDERARISQPARQLSCRTHLRTGRSDSPCSSRLDRVRSPGGQDPGDAVAGRASQRRRVALPPAQWRSRDGTRLRASHPEPAGRHRAAFDAEAPETAVAESVRRCQDGCSIRKTRAAPSKDVDSDRVRSPVDRRQKKKARYRRAGRSENRTAAEDVACRPASTDVSPRIPSALSEQASHLPARQPDSRRPAARRDSRPDPRRHAPQRRILSAHLRKTNPQRLMLDSMVRAVRTVTAGSRLSASTALCASVQPRW